MNADSFFELPPFLLRVLGKKRLLETANACVNHAIAMLQLANEYDRLMQLYSSMGSSKPHLQEQHDICMRKSFESAVQAQMLLRASTCRVFSKTFWCFQDAKALLLAAKNDVQSLLDPTRMESAL